MNREINEHIFRNGGRVYAKMIIDEIQDVITKNHSPEHTIEHIEGVMNNWIKTNHLDEIYVHAIDLRSEGYANINNEQFVDITIDTGETIRMRIRGED